MILCLNKEILGIKYMYWLERPHHFSNGSSCSSFGAGISPDEYPSTSSLDEESILEVPPDLIS